MKPSLVFSFALATFLMIFSSSIFPSFKPVFYAPFLVISFFNLGFGATLWLSCLCGLAVDLFSSSHFGLHALTYVICAFIFYRQRRFFKEAPINIAIFSSIISLFYTIANAALLFLFDSGIKMNFLGLTTDFVVLPLFDGLYALLCFALPIKGFELLKKFKLERDEDEE